jgi:hypothetical protein
MFGNRKYLFSRTETAKQSIQKVCLSAVIIDVSCSLDMTITSICPPGPDSKEPPHLDIQIAARNGKSLSSWISALDEFCRGSFDIDVDGRDIEIRPVTGDNSSQSAEHNRELFQIALNKGHQFRGRSEPIEIRCYFDD